MAPKKKQKESSNGFYRFMQDFKASQGRQFKNMQEVAEAAGPIWAKMSKEQRSVYEMQARGGSKPAKFTSEGLDVSLIEKMNQQEKENLENMRYNINEELKLAGKNGTIQNKMFFLIHINTFCYCASEKKYYPGEIGIAGFNLLEGVLPENIFHSLINPGILPIGYAGDALKVSNSTHQLKPPMGDDIQNNTRDVYIAMKNFLQNNGSRNMPVLYCHEKYMKMAQDILNEWCDEFDDNYIEVYNLQYMFRILKNTVANEDVWSSNTFGSREIEKDVYAFAKNESCEYHQFTGVPYLCSRSTAVRYAFTICDNCCAYLNIQFIAGRHVPRDAAIPTPQENSSASKRSSKSTKSKAYTATVRDDDTESVISVSSKSEKSEWDSQSVSSENSIINDEEFPTLGMSYTKKKPSSRKFVPNETSSVHSNQSSIKSFAGAAGLSRRQADLPSNMLNRNLENLSIGMPQVPLSQGRGVSLSNNSNDDFPLLGWGRGRGVRRPAKR